MPEITCPNCGKTGPLPESAMGSTIRCPRCNERFTVPRGAKPPAVRGRAVPDGQRGKVSLAIELDGGGLVSRQPFQPYPPIPTAHEPEIVIEAVPAAQPSFAPPAPPIPTFIPVPAVPIPTPAASPAPARETQECVYCGEMILASAKKCRHCGEFLDMALRASEETKAIALRSQSHIVSVNNNVSATAHATARGGRMSRLTAAGLLCILFGFVAAMAGVPDAGAFFFGIGILLVIMGAFRSFFKAIFSAFR